MTKKPEATYERKGYTKQGVKYKPVFFSVNPTPATMRFNELLRRGERIEIWKETVKVPQYCATSHKWTKVAKTAWVIYSGGVS